MARNFDTSNVSGEKMKTLNGFFIHLKGMFFFVDHDMKYRIPWKVTLTKGIMPHTDEWNRLQKVYGLTVERLTEEEFHKVIKIRQGMEGDPRKWLTKEEWIAKEKYLKWKGKKTHKKASAGMRTNSFRDLKS